MLQQSYFKFVYIHGQKGHLSRRKWTFLSTIGTLTRTKEGHITRTIETYRQKVYFHMDIEKKAITRTK